MIGRTHTLLSDFHKILVQQPPHFVCTPCVLAEQLRKFGYTVLVMEAASGRAVMCLEAGPGSLLGLPAIISNKPSTLTAMARKDSMIRFVTRDDFEEVVRTDPALLLQVLHILATEVRTARQALSETLS